MGLKVTEEECCGGKVIGLAWLGSLDDNYWRVTDKGLVVAYSTELAAATRQVPARLG